jgi:hypothetical protein
MIDPLANSPINVVIDAAKAANVTFVKNNFHDAAGPALLLTEELIRRGVNFDNSKIREE